MKAEDALKRMQQEEQDKKDKIRGTQERASKNLKSHRTKEREGKQIEEKERAMRKEMKVGGGFDLKKYDALKKNK